MPTDAPKAYIYIRVSHLDSAESGLGIEAQQDRCRNYLKFLMSKPEYAEIESAGVYVDDAVSAYRASTRELITRPQGAQLNKVLKRGDHVIFARLDRAFRWVPDFYETKERWDKRGITMHFVDMQVDMSTATGKMFAGMMAIVAQWYSDYISERTKEALAVKKANGQPVNQKSPAGLRIERDGSQNVYVPDLTQRPLLRYVRILRDVKRLSYRKISDRIEAIFAARENRKPRMEWDRVDAKTGKSWREYACRAAHQKARAQWPESSVSNPCVNARHG